MGHALVTWTSKRLPTVHFQANTGFADRAKIYMVHTLTTLHLALPFIEISGFQRKEEYGGVIYSLIATKVCTNIQ